VTRISVSVVLLWYAKLETLRRTKDRMNTVPILRFAFTAVPEYTVNEGNS
jgi:hypothetical protein